MRKINVFALVLLLALAVACSTQTPVVATPTTVAATATPRKLGTLRFALQGTPDVQDVPRLMALDSLTAQGYTIDQTVFNSSDVIPVALARGDIEFGSNDTSVTWAAITKGSNLRTIVGRTNTTFFLITKTELQTCQDLNSRPMAFNSTTSVGTIMFQKYLNQRCPGVTPQLIVMNGSNNRIAALQKGEIDGAFVELAVWLQLKRQSPGKFRVFVDFGKEFPQVQYSSFSVRQEWAQQNTEAIKDFIRALLTAHRRVNGNPQLLRDQIIKYLSVDSATAQDAADAYLAQNVWDVNGGLTLDSLQAMIEFLASGSFIPRGLQVKDVAELSYLNAVLNEIGRK